MNFSLFVSGADMIRFGYYMCLVFLFVPATFVLCIAAFQAGIGLFMHYYETSVPLKDGLVHREWQLLAA